MGKNAALVFAKAICAGALCIALVGGSGAASRESPRSLRSQDRKPNIILITIDSLRADHLGVYGYRRPTSPDIDAFAREAVVVSDAVAQAPYTKASIASLLTGLFPTTHGAYTTSVSLRILQRSGAVGSSVLQYTDVLSPDLPSLPAALLASGYQTIALSANPYLIPDFGFANGFQRFRYIKGAPGGYAHAAEMMAAATDAVAHATEPYFLWVHLMDTHNPYTPPEPYRSMLPPLTPPRDIGKEQIPACVRIGRSTDLNLYLARYDAGARAADAAIGDFFRWLRARHQWDRTGIVVTADHGEGFMEHGLMSHNNSLYDELLHVPLLMKLPGVRAGRIRTQVQLADLFPTLARWAGASAPAALQGHDVLAALKGAGNNEPFAYSELVGQRYALRSVSWKFIASFQGGRQLFDLGKDPGEKENIARTLAAQSDQMEHLLARALSQAINDSRRTVPHAVPVPPAVLEQLKALGYLAR